MHPPLIPHPDFTGQSRGGIYSDTLAELDHRTGQVLDALDQAGIADNTIVVWSSDNPAGRSTSMGGSNGPWRGHFGSGFEGGMRAPAIVRWPDKVRQDGDRRDPLGGRLASDVASLVGESGGCPRPAHRRRRRLGVPPGPEPDDRADHVIFYGSDAGRCRSNGRP